MSQQKKIKWVHQITLPNGKITPGKFLPSFETYGLPDIEFKNKRVLDIGCNDGLYTFYAEQRGAKEVVSIDITENEKKEHHQGQQTNEGYLYAHKALNSKAKYIFPYSLYDLDKNKVGEFDIVFSLGVIYHLAHPILSLEKINGVMKKEGLLVLETEVSDTFTMFFHKLKHQSKTIEKGNVSGSKMAMNALSYFLARPMAEKKRLFNFLVVQKIRAFIWTLVKPILYPRQEIYKNNDTSVFFVTDDTVMEWMIDFSGFKIVKKIPNPISTRITYICQKVSEVDMVYAQNSIYSKNKKYTTNFTI